jgi:hypothetical protein
MSKNVARMEIDDVLIVEFLQLPKGTRILEIHKKETYLAGKIVYTFVVQNDDLPSVNDGQEIPKIMPSYKRVEFSWNS